MSTPGLRIVTVGCGHGCLNRIYDDAAQAAVERGWTHIDLVIIGGDFQALRNVDDVACLSAPARYRKIGDYHEYYSGQREAPYLTIFCGGNHEASNHLFELYYGGWVAHNIYYLGAANVVRFGPLRIAGMSGIWKGYDYRKPHYERIPYRAEDLSSVFHIRELDVRKLLQIRTQIDIGLSHDWPRQIEHFGDSRRLFRKKRGFEEDSQHGKLGSQAAREVLDRLRPGYWFAAHLHVEFAAAVPHDNVRTKKIDSSRDLPYAWAVEAVDPIPKDIIAAYEKYSLRATTGNQAERIAAWGTFQEADAKTRQEQLTEIVSRSKEERPNENVQVTWKHQSSGKSAIAEDTLVYANKKVKNADEIDLDSDDGSNDEGHVTAPVQPSERESLPVNGTGIHDLPQSTDGANDAVPANMSLVDQAVNHSVSESVRTQLPAAFARPVTKTNPRSKTTPPAIKNKITKFLALDKPGNHDPYLKLLEIAPVSDQADVTARRPYRLQYDKEWLAITRAFAEDLVLGDRTSKVPEDLGEEEYLRRILEEEEWVEANIVKKGMMNIPFNFTRSAPRYNPASDIQHPTMPMEFPNLQTIEFCELLGIENKFFLNEEQRNVNYMSVPATQMATADGGGRRGTGHRGGHRGRGRRGHRGLGRGH